MTATRGSGDTRHPFRGLAMEVGAKSRIMRHAEHPRNHTQVLKLYTSVRVLYAPLDLIASAILTRSAKLLDPILRMAAPR